MRRLLCALLLLLLLTLPVAASGVRSDISVSADGSCQVAMTVRFSLDALPEELTFPLPASAAEVSVNGVAVRARSDGGLRRIDLAPFVAAAGEHTLVLRYRLADAVAANKKGELELALPILCGFAYPLEGLEFSVTLPGEPEFRPHFSSTYYQDTVEALMETHTDGPSIQGSLPLRLQDHETLTMTLQVSEAMFPQPVAKKWSMDSLDLAMLSLAGLAVLYWLIFMAALPPRSLRRTVPPDGITAGELGCRLIADGADLTMTVLSWAQLGYLLIQPDGSGRVLLHKRMDMGNERSDFENRYFRKLFGRREIVDGAGLHYAQLCRQAAGLHPGIRGMYRPFSGNPMIFRGLCACAGAVGGLSLAAAYAEGAWRAVLSVPLAVFCFLAAWALQSLGKALHLRRRRRILPALLAGLLWLLLSVGAGEWNIALIQIPFQLLAGLAALYGGHRTEAGKTAAGEILGLRHYLKTLSPDELERILTGNPQYYYDIAPYACALGVDRAMARRLRELRLPECPYLTTGLDGHMTAAEWNRLLSDTVAAMDNLQRRLWLRRLLGR